MPISDDLAVTVVLIAVSLAAGWGAFLSIRSAESGPVWARRHLMASSIAGGVVTAVGLIVALFVGPVWMGLGVAYIGAVIAFLSWMVNRSLRRAARLGLDEPLPVARRRAVLRKAARGLLGAAGAVAVVAAFDISVRGAIALADLVLVLALAVPGLVAFRNSADPA